MLAVIGGYLVLGWPPAARAILDGLPSPAPTVVDDLPSELDSLVLFDGDNRRGRVRLAEQIIAAASPRAIHVLGSTLILQEMPTSLLAQVVHHPAANTREQMMWVEQFVADGPAARAAIVVSRIQAPRVTRLAARSGLRVPVLASALDVELPAGLWRLAPGFAALAAGRDGLYEHAAIGYYYWKGWI